MPNSGHAAAQLYAALRVTGTNGGYNRGGANGTLFRVDPREELVVVYMAHAPGEPRLYYRALMKSLVMQALVKQAPNQPALSTTGRPLRACNRGGRPNLQK